MPIPVMQVPEPYPTFRMDVLATIANLAYHRRSVQDAFVELDVVQVVLSNCAFSPECPGVREWALLAIRNLCEGNEMVQSRIASLSSKTVVEDKQLRADGQRVVFDQSTGKFTMETAEV
jgi:ataxin-10